MPPDHTRFRLHPIYRLGVLAMAGGALAAAPAAAQQTDHSAHAAAPLQMAQAAEGEGAQDAPLESDDIAYLTQLNLIRGHLHVGVELYREGHPAAAATHMKHPQDELYAALVPAFEARGVDGFEDALEALAARVEAQAPQDEVDQAFAAVEARIERAEQGAAEALDDPAACFGVVVKLMRTAADEYAIGVVDGRVENAHEYQDAFGFVHVARGIVDRVAQDRKLSKRKDVAEAVTTAREQIDAVQDLWVGVMPPERLDRDPARLYVATAHVELAAVAID